MELALMRKHQVSIVDGLASVTARIGIKKNFSQQTDFT